MKISCTQENLNKGVQIVSHVASKASNLPILQHVLLTATQGSLELAATNLELGVKVKVRAKVEEEGTFTVPAQMLASYVSLLPKERVDVLLKEKELEIKAGTHKASIKGESAEEFPVLPSIEGGVEIPINTAAFRDGLSQTIFAAASDETRPEISGVLFWFHDSKLTLVATDSYRLAEKHIDLTSPVEDKKVIVPQATLYELGRMLEDGDEITKVVVAENQILFRSRENELISRVIEGAYPEYTQIIPSEHRTDAHVSSAQFSKVIKAAALFTKSGVNDVSLDISAGEGSITIKAVNNQVGENVSSVSAEVQGETNSIIFNYRFLLDGLSAMRGEDVSLKCLDGANPGVFRPKGDESYTYIIMPIRQ